MVVVPFFSPPATHIEPLWAMPFTKLNTLEAFEESVQVIPLLSVEYPIAPK